MTVAEDSGEAAEPPGSAQLVVGAFGPGVQRTRLPDGRVPLQGQAASRFVPPRDEGALSAPGTTYRRWLLVLLRRLGSAALRLAFTVRVTGQGQVPPRGAVLIVGNHEGLLDGPLVEVFAPRPVRALAKAELYHGVLGWFLRVIGQIPVHRGRPDRTALRAGAAVLAAGEVLAVFPEGTRGDGAVEQIQHGAAYVLMKSGLARVPVVPVHCSGTAYALPRHARWPAWRAQVSIAFGSPTYIDIPLDRRSRSSVAQVAEQIRCLLAEHVQRGQGSDMSSRQGNQA
jgi:1-acyl-sn-glycerol-3-phosphate acyltransferase